MLILHSYIDIKYNQQICWYRDLKSFRSRQSMLSYASSSLLKRASCLKSKFDEIKKVGIHNQRKIEQSQENYSQRYGLFSQMIKFSGLLRGQWTNQNKLQSICYGSSVAISKRIILTCAHSIYHSDNQLVCDSVSFIPNHEQGKLNKNQKVFHSTDQNYIKFKQLKEGQKFGKYPLSEDLALIYLSEDLQLQNFPSVGVYKNTKIQQKSSIMICGYPSIGYQRCSNLNKIDFSRVILQGKLVNIIGDTIYHQLDTKTGHSGSAIFGINPQTDQPTILGIHTHKGSRNNSGVYLNYSNLKRLAKYEIQFGIAHSQYQMDIKFPQQIKNEAWNELSEDQKSIFRNRVKYYHKMGGKLEEEKPNKLIKDCYQNISKSFIPQEEISEMSKIHNFYQEELDIEKNNLQTLMQRNIIMKQKILKKIQFSKYKEYFSEWQQIERSFLETFTQLQEKSNIYPFKNIKNSNDTNKIFSNCSKQLIHIKEKYDRNGQIEIICLKIAPIDHHLNCSNYINQIYVDSSQNPQ